VCLACKKPSAKCALWHVQSLLLWPRGRWGYEWRSGNRLRSRRSNLERTPNARRLWLLALITVGHRYHSNRAPQCEQMHASSLNGVAKFSTRRQANEPCDICIPGIAHEFRGDGFAQFRPPAISDLAARDQRDFDTSDAGTARAVEPQVFRM